MATGDTGKQVDPKRLADAMRNTTSKGKTPEQWAGEVHGKAGGKR